MSDEIREVITGEFVHEIFKTDSYMVVRFRTNDSQITVTGPSFDYERNQKYNLTGYYVVHPKYGHQFNYVYIERAIANNAEEIISFLSSKTFPGIGKKTAEKIYNFFGDDTLNILKDDFDKIYQLDLNEKHLFSLQEGFKTINSNESQAIFYLVSNGLNNNEAHIIYNYFKDETLDVAADNPFRFYNEIYAISFEKIKKFAQKIEFEDSENKYREAFLIHYLNDYTFSTGDIYIEYDNLKQLIEKYNYFDNLDDILNNACNHNYLVNDNNRIYLFNEYYDEKYIADYLNNMSNDLLLEENVINDAIIDVQSFLNINYDDRQKEAIKNFLLNNFSMIIGGPGTGKTTIIKTMAYIFNKYLPYNNLIVVAPTGRAAKRINEICNVESKTIHSLLRWDKNTNTFAFNIDNPLMYDAIIIDEFSMVDNNLFACLLKASKNIKKICVIGDNNQLPSIKPGDLLADLIQSNKFNLTILNNNYRQQQGNEIIDLANDIIDDNVDINRYQNDIKFYDINKSNFDLINSINNNLYEGYTLDDIQVLTPMHKGIWGIDNLNNVIQNAFNPSDITKKEKKLSNTTFREFDKILQLKNRPTDDVYNGDIGLLIEVNEKEKYLLVDFNDTYVFYQNDDLLDIALAYAMSVHKAQGSEYQVVYFIISKSNLHMLNKKLIYTAISRAKKKLVIIGEENLLMQGLSKQMNKRKTTLLERLV